MKAKYLSPIITAFYDEGNYDFKANDLIIENTISNGIDGIVLLGSNGEFFAFNVEQKKKIIEHCKKVVDNRVQLIVGTGSMSIDETIELSKYCEEIGITDVMVISPYYFNLSDESIYEYYKKLAENISINIYLYNFPDRTGYNIDADVVLKLARKYKNVVGYKDSNSDPAHIKQIINVVKKEFPNFIVYAGTEDFFSMTVLLGGNGSIGALANVAPEICSNLAKAYNDNDLEKASLYQRKISKLTEIYAINKPFIPAMKKAMILNGMDLEDNSYFPFNKLNNEQTEKLKCILDEARTIN